MHNSDRNINTRLINTCITIYSFIIEVWSTIYNLIIIRFEIESALLATTVLFIYFSILISGLLRPIKAIINLIITLIT